MFAEMIELSMADTGGSLCVGLDPHGALIPDRFKKSVKGIQSFLDWIVDETLEHACAYKPNSAFYEVLGSQGWDVLGYIIDRIHRSGRPVILDAKRSDIASTAAAYASAAFDILEVDAITLVPYMGEGAIVPFLQKGGFAFVLASPSNPSSRRIVEHGTPSLAECVASMTVELAEEYPHQLGLVVGATHPDTVTRLDDLSADLPWLVPGMGAQGGQVNTFFESVHTKRHLIVNASRSILFASDPKQAAKQMKQELKEAQFD